MEIARRKSMGARMPIGSASTSKSGVSKPTSGSAPSNLFQCQTALLNKVLGFNRRSRQNYLLPRASLLQSRQNLQPPLMLRFRRIQLIHGSASAKRMLWVRQKEGLPRNGVPAPGLKFSRIRVHLHHLRCMDPLLPLHARIFSQPHHSRTALRYQTGQTSLRPLCVLIMS